MVVLQWHRLAERVLVRLIKKKKLNVWFVFQLKKWMCKYLSTGTAFMFIHPRTRSTYFSIWMIINMFTSYQNQSYLIWEYQFIFRCVLRFTTSVSYPVQHSQFWYSSFSAHNILRCNWGLVSKRLRDMVVCFDYCCVNVSCQKNWMDTLWIYAVLPTVSERQHFSVFLVSSNVLVQEKDEVQSQ